MNLNQCVFTSAESVEPFSSSFLRVLPLHFPGQLLYVFHLFILYVQHHTMPLLSSFHHCHFTIFLTMISFSVSYFLSLSLSLSVNSFSAFINARRFPSSFGSTHHSFHLTQGSSCTKLYAFYSLFFLTLSHIKLFINNFLFLSLLFS